MAGNKCATKTQQLSPTCVTSRYARRIILECDQDEAYHRYRQ